MKKKPRNFLNLLISTMVLAACPGKNTPLILANPTEVATELALARAKIQHVVIIQENRSFDHYFGTYPGADRIPMQNGVPTVCAYDPITRQCIQPFHDTRDVKWLSETTLNKQALGGGMEPTLL